MSSSDVSLTEAQWDLLADYLGGALDGDQRYDQVTALIDADPVWRDAHEALAEATDAVRADLGTMAAAPIGPMPADLAARLDEALREEFVAPVVPLRRHRVPRWAVPATIAAGVLAFASIGLTGLLDGNDRDVATSAGAAPDAASAPEAASAPMLAQQVLFSGRDYTPDSAAALADQVEERGVAGAETLSSPLSDTAAGRPPAPMQEDAGGAVPPVLARLTDPEALRRCLGAIAVEHGMASLTARLIDYASFQGSPGLLVLFTDPAGQDMVWVAGPECGADGMLADTLYRAPVG
ncbi:hypothetical protein J2S43_007021 [Catenuloplanes nepalensis]|uniref:Anti-sigma factor n=1 Tax=Catenuloplanes nepalensis TaxID=587533 RepID=A0ABT9N482_9ACTN|nr:hypothetical protein [Catenuloplanes nepalensis]MDP9798509.1 hypothetical protein [Catenuloplanes nepalensis]